MNGSNVDAALQECRGFVVASAHHLPMNPNDLDVFIAKFREDFECVFGTNPGAWPADRRRVTSLARAIGAYAEFLALIDKDKTTEVAYKHLKGSFEVLGPTCVRREQDSEIDREYCKRARP